MPKKIKSDRQLELWLEEITSMKLYEAKDVPGAVGFIARPLVQCSLPHRDPGISEIEKVNGHFHLSMQAPGSVGLPYGVYPRLILYWICTEVVRTGERTLHLGPSLSSFMRVLGLEVTGGRRGTIGILRKQMGRLFKTSMRYWWSDIWVESSALLAVDRHQLWWDPKRPEQMDLWNSWIELGQAFYDQVYHHSVPIDMRAVRVLRSSPLKLDIYTWLTFRMFSLRRQTELSWGALALQFGSDYKQTRDFRMNFLGAMKEVLQVYDRARVREGKSGLVLSPSPTHVRKLPSVRKKNQGVLSEFTGG